MTKLHDIDVSIVVDLPENPTPEQILTTLIEDLAQRLQAGTFDGAVAVEQLED